MFQPGKHFRFLTADGLRYGGEILEVEDGLLRLHDNKSGREVVLAIASITRAEEVLDA